MSKFKVLTPQTGFQMKGDFGKTELPILASWDTEPQFPEKWDSSNCPKFILHDGPPYANGNIHLGHALNKILKDIYVRSNVFLGNDVSFIPGWDCHGLPIEQQVIKNLGVDLKGKSPLEVRKLCHEYALQYVTKQMDQFKRLGTMAEWEKSYKTLSNQYELGILKCLKTLVEKGFIYKAKKPVFWDWVFETALANSEVEHKELESPSIYLAFPCKDEQNVSIAVWTTTPWTLPANAAICVNPKATYVYAAFENLNKILIMGKDCVEDFSKLVSDKYEILSETLGENLLGQKYENPLQSNRIRSVVCDEFVKTSVGTGCVHLAPGHGKDDYIVGLKYKLQYEVVVNEKGKMDIPVDNLGLNGLHFLKADAEVIEYLNRFKAILHADKFKHEYPFSWRSHKPVVDRGTEQWFVDLSNDEFKDNLNKAIESVEWYPENGKDRMKMMVSQRLEWCISRQRYWGVPIPSFKDSSGNSVLDIRVLDNLIKELEETECGTDVWFEKPLTYFLPDEWKDQEEWVKETDVLDVWFDSGASYLGALAASGLPTQADMYLEGDDQFRGWFQSALLLSVATQGIAPYKKVVSHGFILDSKGVAMSKSTGNVIAPEEVIKKFGADTLRLWAASEDYKSNVSVSQEMLNRNFDLYKRIRNTFKFMLGNIHDFEVSNAVKYLDLEKIDKLILDKFAQEYLSAKQAYVAGNFHAVVKIVENLCFVDLGSVYFDAIKDRLYCDAQNSKVRRSAQSVLAATIPKLVGLVKPILPFLAHEVELLCPENRFSLLDLYSVPVMNGTWNRLLGFRSKINEAIEPMRRSKEIGHNNECNVDLFLADDDYVFLMERSLVPTLRNLTLVSELSIYPLTSNEEERIIVKRSDKKKCERCWSRYDGGNESLCDRCVECESNG